MCSQCSQSPVVLGIFDMVDGWQVSLGHLFMVFQKCSFLGIFGIVDEICLVFPGICSKFSQNLCFPGDFFHMVNGIWRVFLGHFVHGVPQVFVLLRTWAFWMNSAWFSKDFQNSPQMFVFLRIAHMVNGICRVSLVLSVHGAIPQTIPTNAPHKLLQTHNKNQHMQKKSTKPIFSAAEFQGFSLLDMWALKGGRRTANTRAKKTEEETRERKRKKKNIYIYMHAVESKLGPSFGFFFQSKFDPRVCENLVQDFFGLFFPNYKVLVWYLKNHK